MKAWSNLEMSFKLFLLPMNILVKQHIKKRTYNQLLLGESLFYSKRGSS